MKYYLFLILFSVSFAFTYAQGDYDDELPPSNNDEFVGFGKKEKNRKKEFKKNLCKMRIGGSLGFGYYNGLLNLGISPQVGYQIVEDRLEFGGGFSYDYQRFKNSRYTQNQHIIGPTAYARVYIWRGIFAQVRGVYLYGFINQIDRQTKIKSKGEDTFGNVYAAAGYSIDMGGTVFFNIGLEINLIAYDLSTVNASARRVISPFINFQFALCRNPN